MASVRSRVAAVGLRRIANAVVVLGFLGFFVLTGGWRLLAFVVAGWFDGALGLFDEFEAAHRIHEFAFAMLIWPAVVGLVAQLGSPRKHVAGQLMALIPWAALLVAFALTDHWAAFPMIATFGAVTLLAALVHPAGRDLVGSFTGPRVSRLLLALVLVAAAPLVAFSATQVGLQTGAIEQGGHEHGEAGGHAEVHEEHVEYGHFAMMAAFGFVVIGLGLLASLRPTGWWLPAGFVGLMAAFYGLASVAFPETASSAGTTWGVAAVGWGVVFVAAALLEHGGEAPSPYGDHEVTPLSED